MNVTDPVQTLPPYLAETADMVRAAFPKGIPEEVYQPVLALLVRGMSQRTLAQVMSYCTGRSYFVAYHDALGAASAADSGHVISPAYERAARACANTATMGGWRNPTRS